MSSESQLLIRRRGAVVELRLNRPDKRNAIDDALRAELLQALEALSADQAVRSLVLTGEGKAFCAGGDVSAMHERLQRPLDQVAAAGLRRVQLGQRLVLQLHELDMITIAAVNGPAAGYGMDLALACDFVITADAAFFAMSYIQRGLVPDGGGAYFLARRVGLSRAKELILSGRRVPAQEALDLGIADRMVPLDHLDDAAHAWATELAQAPPVAATLSKSILNRSLDLPLRDILKLSAQATAICYTTEEHLQLVEEFRSPDVKGKP